jgi:hypothetical protein
MSRKFREFLPPIRKNDRASGTAAKNSENVCPPGCR